MLHWIQYMKGYVSIKVWGYSRERFLNLCGNHDILVWDIENHGDYDTMKVSVDGFFALKTLLRKTGTRASVLQRHGLPFFVPKMKKRKKTLPFMPFLAYVYKEEGKKCPKSKTKSV